MKRKYSSEMLPENVQKQINALSKDLNGFDIAYRLRLSPYQVLEHIEYTQKEAFKTKEAN